MIKTSYIHLLSIVIAVFTVAACEERIPFVEPEIEGEDLSRKITTEAAATVQDFVVYGQSRAEYQFEGCEMHFSWNDDDHIGFWPDQNDLLPDTRPEQASFFIKTGAGQTGVAEFEACGWGLINDKRYYAYYPYDKSAAYNCVNISYDGQIQSTNGSTAHIGAFDYMHSYVDVSENEDWQVDFKHLGCVAAFTLTIPQEYRVCHFTGLTLSADSAVFVKEATYDPSVTTVSLTETQTGSEFSIQLGTDNTEGISCDANGRLTVYLSLAPAVGSANWNGIPVSLVLSSSDGKQFNAVVTPSSSQQAGFVYPFSVDMQYDGPSVVNLSQQETANCYIVSNAGYYMFGSTKGNSTEAVIPGSVKVLWETVNTSVAPTVNTLINDDVTYSNGYIYFSTPDNFVKGNALIAAYSGNNYTGDILWSWHIWFTDCPEDEEYPNNAGFLMDRNLGALSTSGNLAIGLLYQWGRKDPMMGHVTSSSSAAMAASRNGTTLVNNSPSVGTIDWSIKHPCQYIKGATNGDWLYANPKAGTDYDITKPDVNKSRWYGGEEVKTKYDPCPPGYMIPYSGPGTNDKDFWGTAYNVAFRVPGSNNSFNLGGVTVPYVFNSGLWMPLANGKTSFYPFAGYIATNGARANDGKHLMQWTNFPAGSGSATTWHWHYSNCLDVNVTGSGAYTTHWNSTRADGKSVRCFRMKKSLELGNEGFGDPIHSEW